MNLSFITQFVVVLKQLLFSVYSKDGLFMWPILLLLMWLLFFLRSHAIACVNQFIVTRTQALMVHIGTFIEVHILYLFIVIIIIIIMIIIVVASIRLFNWHILCMGVLRYENFLLLFKLISHVLAHSKQPCIVVPYVNWNCTDKSILGKSCQIIPAVFWSHCWQGYHWVLNCPLPWSLHP